MMVRGFLNGNGLRKKRKGKNNIDHLVGVQDSVNEDVECVGRWKDVEPFLAITDITVDLAVFNRINSSEE